MQTYYEVVRTRTAKPVGNNRDWQSWEQDRHTFSTVKEARAFLKEEYGTCKKQKMFIDGHNEEPVHVGYIYCYNTPPQSNDDCHHNNQDWVKVHEIKSTNIIIK